MSELPDNDELGLATPSAESAESAEPLVQSDDAAADALRAVIEPGDLAGAEPTAGAASEAAEVLGVTASAAAHEAMLVEDLGLIERKSAEPTGDMAAEPEPPPDAADLPPSELRAVVEGLLFVSTKPLSIERLVGCLPGTSVAYLEGFLHGLAARYNRERRGWELRQEAHGWRLMTRPDFHPWVRQLERKELPTKLSKGALETLAVVAYKQPVARGKIEDIRGVQCGPVLRQLMDLKLVSVIGRDDHALGRPLLYGTTDHFLTRFGIGSPADLPKRHEFGE